VDGKGSTEDFRRMYENVDAVTDMPALGMWEEILRAFPDAKVILCERADEEVWLKSFYNQMEYRDNWFFFIAAHLIPFWRRILTMLGKAALAYSGYAMAVYPSFPRPKTPRNDLFLKNWYRRHNAHVKQNTPKDQLLLFDLKQGWGPLCEFLDKPVPDIPFPHLNKKGNVKEIKAINTHPYTEEIKKSVKRFVATIVGITSYLGYHFINDTFGESYLGKAVRFGINFVSSYF